MPDPQLPASLTTYLSDAGWIVESEGPIGQLWAHGDDTVGIPFGLSPKDSDWPDVLRRVAVAMKLPLDSIESGITRFWRDELEFRVPGSSRVPLRLGSRLYRCAYTSFRAAATTAQSPKAFLRRQYSQVGDRLVGQAMFDQTRIGSYVVPVGIELESPPAPPPGVLPIDVVKEPLQRRVTRTLQESLNAIERLVITPEHEPRKSDTAALVSVGVSREMVASIEAVASTLEEGEMTVTANWATAVAAPKVAASVSVPAGAAERLRTVSGFLQVARAPKTENVSGQIVSMDDDNRNPGTITIETVRRGRQCRVKVFLLDRQQTETAHKWFETHETVIAHGHVSSASGEHPTMQPESVAPLSDVILPSS